MFKKKIYIVFNPTSGGGKTGKKLNDFLSIAKKYFSNQFIYEVIENSLTAETSVRNSILKGYDLIIAVGGDGTIQTAANGFFSNGEMINRDCRLGIISCGTGQGFAQSLNLPASIEKQIEIIKEGNFKIADLGRINYPEQIGCRYFVNEFQAGIGGTVVKKVSVNLKKYGGKFSFGLCTLASVINYKAEIMDFVIGDKRVTRNLLGIVVSNGKYTGGGMQLTPNASLTDGLFDVLLIPSMPHLKRLFVFPKIYSANHINLNGFECFRARKLRILSTNCSLIEADGELINEKCSTIEIVPHCLKVFTN